MKTKRVLLVDDHPAMRHGLAQLIENEPDLEVCCEADDRASALKLLRTGNPDLIVLDIALKDKATSGLDLIQDIRSRCPQIPILMVSMHNEALYAERALRAGARGYLMKQEPVREVIVAIRRILEGGVYLSTAMSDAMLLKHVANIKSAVHKDPIESLSNREFEVFRLVGQGLQPRQIAEQLHLGVKTVETHRLNIRKKLGLPNAAALTRFAVEWMRENY